MSDDRKRPSEPSPESGPPKLGEAWEGEGAEATIATPFERFSAAPVTPRGSGGPPPTTFVGNGPSTVPKPPSAPRAPQPSSSGTPPRPAMASAPRVGSAPRMGSAPRAPVAARTPEVVPRLSEDTDSENDRTRADALPGMAAALQNLGKPAPKAPIPGAFGVVPDVGADLDPPSSEEDAATRAISREELGRPPDSSRVVFDRDAGGYEATLAASFPSSSGQGGEKIAAALAEALQGRELASTRGPVLSILNPADPMLRPPMQETLQTPQYPPGVPPPAPGPVLPSSSRFPAARAPVPGLGPAAMPGPMQGAAPGAPPMFNGPMTPSAPPFANYGATAPLAAPPLSPPWRSQVGSSPMTGASAPYPLPPSPMLPVPPPQAGPKKHLVLFVVVGAVVCITIFVVGVVLILSTTF